MQEVYRIIVTPYNYDYWDIFTTDKALFDLVSKFSDTEELRDILGNEKYEEIHETYMNVKPPYVLLGETQLMQPN